MQNFGLGDLAAIGVIIVVFVAWYMEVPQRLWARAAPALRAFASGDVLQVHILSSREGDGDEAEEDENNVFLPAETNSEIAETPQRVAEIQAESFTLGETTALARLVVAGKVGLTDAVKFGAEAKSGERYQRRSREVKAIVDRLQNKYPHGTPEQERLRRELGLSKQ